MNAFVAHIVGDFILQTEWMALNKKRYSYACAMHAMVYITPFLLSNLLWWQLLLIGLQHFLQDRTEFVLWWMRAVKRVPQGQMGVLPLFVDQAFHVLWIQIVLLLAGAVSV